MPFSVLLSPKAGDRRRTRRREREREKEEKKKINTHIYSSIPTLIRKSFVHQTSKPQLFDLIISDRIHTFRTLPLLISSRLPKMQPTIESHKAEIRQLFLSDHLAVSTIQEIMRKKYNFHASYVPSVAPHYVHFPHS